MIKRIFTICLVALLAYYMGAKGLTPVNISDWIEERNITEILKNTISKTLELAKEKQVVEKAENLIVDLKEKISD